MDNAQKAIMIGVGLFITIIIIAAVMLITGMGQDLLNSGQAQVTNISTNLQSQLTDSFDGTTMNGSAVVSAIKRYRTDEGLGIGLKNKSGSLQQYGTVKLDVGTNYVGSVSEYTGTESANKVGKLSTTTDVDNYVPSTAQYSANLIKTSAGAVVGIYFEQK